MNRPSRLVVDVDNNGLGSSALIHDGQIGQWSAENDVDALAEILCSLPAARPVLADLTRAGRALIEREFSLASQLLAARRLYEDLARSRSPAGAASRSAAGLDRP